MENLKWLFWQGRRALGERMIMESVMDTGSDFVRLGPSHKIFRASELGNLFYERVNAKKMTTATLGWATFAL